MWGEKSAFIPRDIFPAAYVTRYKKQVLVLV